MKSRNSARPMQKQVIRRRHGAAQEGHKPFPSSLVRGRVEDAAPQADTAYRNEPAAEPDVKQKTDKQTKTYLVVERHFPTLLQSLTLTKRKERRRRLPLLKAATNKLSQEKKYSTQYPFYNRQINTGVENPKKTCQKTTANGSIMAQIIVEGKTFGQAKRSVGCKSLQGPSHAEKHPPWRPWGCCAPLG